MARRIRWQIVIAFLSAVLIALLLGGLALRSTSVASPLAGGVYSEALVGAPVQPIPLLNDPLTDPVGRDLLSLLFDGLVRIGADGLIEPALAESYSIEQSGTIYYFNLRRNARWHDGQPVSAADVVFTLRTLQVLEQAGEPALAEFWSKLLVDRIDDYTVRVTLNEPFAPFLSLARVPILPAHLLAGIPPAGWATAPFARQLIGSGPFRLAELRADGATLLANDDYFGGRPYLARIDLSFNGLPEGARAALNRGDVLAFGERFDGETNEAGQARNLRSSKVPLDEYAVLSFNLREAPLNDRGVRQALAYGLNKVTLIEQILAGAAVPLDNPILPSSWAYNPTARWPSPDPTTAERIFGELGWERGPDSVRQRGNVRLNFELLVDADPHRRAAAEEIGRQWGELGIGVELVEMSGPALQQRLQTGAFQLALHGWTRIGPDPDPFALWHSAGPLNYAGLADPEIDTLLQAARQESELAERSADYAAFQQRWVELVPAITLYQPLYQFTADARLGGIGLDDPTNTLSGLLFGPEDRYRTITRWYTDSYREIQGDLQRQP